MVQIHIDTDKDSKQNLRKVIQFLQQFVNEQPSWPSSQPEYPPQRPAPAYDNQSYSTPSATPQYMEREHPVTPEYSAPAPSTSSTDMFAMFDSSTPSTTTQDMPSSQSLIDEDEDDRSDGKPPKLVPY